MRKLIGRMGLLLMVVLLASGTSYGVLLENIADGTGAGYVSMDVNQGGTSTDIQIRTDQWATSGDLDRSVNALAREDAVLLFTVGSTVDATWLSDTSAWTVVSSSQTGIKEYITTMERTVGSATVTVKATTTLDPSPNKDINQKYEISVTGAALTDVKFFEYNDFQIDLGTGDRSIAVGETGNSSGDYLDYSSVSGTPGSNLTLLAYDSFVSSGGVPAPPPGQIDIAIGIKEITTVSKWEISEYSTIGDKLQDLVMGITTDLNLLNSDTTGGALVDGEYAFQYNLGTISSSGGATVEFQKVVTPVPEPSTLLLIGFGLLGLGIYRKKR